MTMARRSITGPWYQGEGHQIEALSLWHSSYTNAGRSILSMPKPQCANAVDVSLYPNLKHDSTRRNKYIILPILPGMKSKAGVHARASPTVPRLCSSSLRIQSPGKLMRTDQRNRLEAQTQLIVEHMESLGLSLLEFGGVVKEACKLFVMKNRLIHVFYPSGFFTSCINMGTCLGGLESEICIQAIDGL